MDLTKKVAELIDFAHSRSNWMRGGVALVGGTAVANSTGLGRAFAQALTDLDILNFALTLEHLEARMYKDMLAANMLTGKEKTYFENFGKTEAVHVTALTQTIQKLNGTPAAAKEKYNFPAFSDRVAILNFAKVAEDIGVGAYQGAAAAIKNKDILAAAGSIVQIEARHAAIVNLLLGQKPVPAATTASLTVQQVLDKVNPILGS
ncbi:MAG: ferritin-like domain-containing protein [Ardenticatenales bacterium]|nr:ferritin-like domain-containing protein [Ardenticatenales bacterium]